MRTRLLKRTQAGERRAPRHLLRCWLPVVLAAGALSTCACAQGVLLKPSTSVRGSAAAETLPEAPLPAALMEVAGDAVSGGQEASGSSVSQSDTNAKKIRREKAREQIREEERQRVLGIVPAFDTTYRSDAVSLSAGQKMGLAFRSAADPFTLAGAVLVAGIYEADDDDAGFGWGAEGFGKRAGAAYLDVLDGTILGEGILPALLHQDPRYFRLGQGTMRHRLLYAAAMTVVCKHDNSGRWEPNYSNIAGNILSGAISNVYYPEQGSGAEQAISAGLIVTAEGTAGSIFQEFWPDISRRLFHKDPTHGLDDEARAAAARGKRQKQPLPAEK